MVVAFDLRPLQSGHQFRGIGIALQNIMLELLKNPQLVKNWEVVYYVNEKAPLPPILNGELPFGRIIEAPQFHPKPSPFRTLRYLNRVLAAISKRSSINKLPELGRVDVFIQFDFWLGLPQKRGIKSVLIKYDIIPLVLGSHYLPTYSSVKSRQNMRAAIKAQYNRWFYLSSLKKCLDRSDLVLAISKHTKDDLVKYLGVSSSKIKVLYLAADQPPETNEEAVNQEIKSLDWRLISGQKRLQSVSIKGKPYLLYIGGADYRRRVQDLVSAFNQLKATGVDCRLFLVGFDFQDINTVPNVEIKKALSASSFGEDIHLLGFVTPEQKHHLYNNAVAYVYPTMYEGFGLPVLEAMSNRCPVICYDNSSLKEVGGDAALYTKNPDGIIKAVNKLLNSKNYRDQIIKKGLDRTEAFSWQETAKSLIDYINPKA